MSCAATVDSQRSSAGSSLPSSRGVRVERSVQVDGDTPSRVRRGRLPRVREQMASHDMAALLLVGPVDVRHANDTRNRHTFTARNAADCLFIALEGPVILFGFAGPGPPRRRATPPSPSHWPM